MVEQIRIIMKAQFLKIAKVKDEKAFYKKYPTEEAFFKAHPEAKKSIKKARIGAYIGGDMIPNAEMIDFQDSIDVAEKQSIGSTQAEREAKAYDAAMLKAQQDQAKTSTDVMNMIKSSGEEGGGLMDMIGGEGGGIGGGSEGGGGLMEMLGGLFGGGAGGGMRYGGNVPKAYGGTNVNNWWSNITTSVQTTEDPNKFDINKFGIGPQTMGKLGGSSAAQTTPAAKGTPPDTSNPNWMMKDTSGPPYAPGSVTQSNDYKFGEEGTDQNLSSKLGGLTKLAGPVGGLIEGIDALKGEKEELARAKQLRMLTDLQLTASRTRPEEKERRYVRPEDVVNTGEPFFPIYGVGTNVLARDGVRLQSGGRIGGNPTEIQNTYGDGNSIYDNLGYVPLIDEDKEKNFRYGGDVPRAQTGWENYLSTISGGGSGFSGSGSGGTPWGAIGGFATNAANFVQGGGNAGGKVGGTIGGSIGAIFGPAGQAIGNFVGTIAGNELDPYVGGIKLNKKATKRNVQNIAYNDIASNIVAQQGPHVRNGGEIPIAQKGRKQFKLKDEREGIIQTKDQLEDRNVFSQNQSSFKKPVVQKEIKRTLKEAANPKVVIFAESPKDKPTYMEWDANLPKELEMIRQEQAQAQATLDSVLMTDKKYKDLFNKKEKLSNLASELEIKYGYEDPRAQQAWNNAARADLEISKYRNTPELEKKITPYQKALSALYDKFRESEFNPKVMDSTFYKEAQNVKDFYKRTDPNTKVDIVPLYGDKKLMQRKLKGMTPSDKFAIFGHSGDKLAGISNDEIAEYLSKSRVEDCYFGSCGFESHITGSPFENLKGKTLNYRPSGNLWLGFNPAAKTFDEGMWSRQDTYNGDGHQVSPIKPGVSYITNKLEDGGYMNPEYNPQLITMFGDHTAEDFADYAHKYRAGGHLKSYTPPSNKAMETFAMGGELKTHWGGYAETMSQNPYLPGTGETVMFRGQSHDESDGKGRTGIGVSYGPTGNDDYTDYAEYGTTAAEDKVDVEVERGEPMVQLQEGNEIDPATGEPKTSGVVFGNLRIPDRYLDLLGDPKAKGKKFKHYIADKSKEEARINKEIEKSTNELNALDVKSSGDRLTLAALEAKIKGGNMKLQKIADIKITSAGIQDAYNKTAEEYGLVADDLARGKIKIDKEADMQTRESRFGDVISKAKRGVTTTKETTTAPKKIEEYTSVEALKAAGFKQNAKGEWYRPVEEKKKTSTDKKSASAMDNIPKQSVDQKTGLFGGVTPEQFEEYKKKNSWYDWTDFDPTDPEDVDKYAKAFNAEAKKRGSKARIMSDELDPKTKKPIPGGKTKYVGKQLVSGVLEDVKEEEPGEEAIEIAVLREPGNTPVPYKRSKLIDYANQALDYIRPTDQEGFDYGQAMGELYALSNNQLEPVQAQMYKPELRVPYDISYQDVLNENQADFNALIRKTGYNPAAQSMVDATKYMANQKVLGDQFRANQAMKDQVYAENRNILNQAKLTNLGILDKQYERQAEALSNTKATTLAALNSLDDKIAKHKLENRTLGIYENLYKYRYDKSGRAINMNPLFQPNIPTVGSTTGTQKQVPIYGPDGKTITGYQLQEMTPQEIIEAQQKEQQQYTAVPSLATLPINGNIQTKTKKTSRNGSIVKAIKNL